MLLFLSKRITYGIGYVKGTGLISLTENTVESQFKVSQSRRYPNLVLFFVVEAKAPYK
jgi:hypothetical protein